MAQKIFNYKATQISIHTMKYENTNYISIGTCFVFLLPIILFTASLTYCVSDTFHSKPMDLYPTPRTDLVADSDDMPLDTPEFQTGDEALFRFTGDTVLVLGQPEPLAISVEEVRVLRKRPNGNLETADIPQNWLVKLNADTAKPKPPVPPNDRLEQYKKTFGR